MSEQEQNTNHILVSYSTFYKAKAMQERNILFFWSLQHHSGSSVGLATADILV